MPNIAERATTMAFYCSVQKAGIKVNVEGNERVIFNELNELIQYFLHASAISLQHIVGDSR